MVVYVVTGAGRGLGYEFVRQFSQDSTQNIVFGLVRNKEAADKSAAADGLKNVHFLSADVNDQKSLNAAKAEIEKITPVVDVLINNAVWTNLQTHFRGLTEYENEPEVLDQDLTAGFRTNVIGVVKVTNTILPLIKKSNIKKVIAISTGFADDAFTNENDIYEAATYSITKAALNTVIAKYNAQHGKSSDGILFMAISPGVVDTGNEATYPPDFTMPQKFAKAYPSFTGPLSPEAAATAVMAVANKADASNEFAGAFVSHLGTKQWL